LNNSQQIFINAKNMGNNGVAFDSLIVEPTKMRRWLNRQTVKFRA